MEKIFCAECGKLINDKNTHDKYCYVAEGFYYEDCSCENFYCEECGDDLFCWNDSINEYIWKEDDRDTFYDDAISDLSIVTLVPIEELELVDDEEQKIERKERC